MKLNKRLNVVIAIDREDGSTVHVHSTPISTDVFDQHYRALSKTYVEMHAGGVGNVGPKIAYKVLRDVAKTLGCWKDPGGVEQSLIGEIYRNTMVLVPTAQGYEQVLFYQAKQQKMIDPEDIQEIEGRLVFFTCSVFLMQRHELSMLYEMLLYWGVQTTALNSTDYMNSLSTSNADANSGVTVAA